MFQPKKDSSKELDVKDEETKEAAFEDPLNGKAV